MTSLKFTEAISLFVQSSSQLASLSTRVCSILAWDSDFPGGSDGKASVYNAGDLGSIPGSGRFPGEGNGNALQYSCLDGQRSLHQGSSVHGVTNSQRRLSEILLVSKYTPCEPQGTLTFPGLGAWVQRKAGGFLLPWFCLLLWASFFQDLVEEGCLLLETQVGLWGENSGFWGWPGGEKFHVGPSPDLVRPPSAVGRIMAGGRLEQGPLKGKLVQGPSLPEWYWWWGDQLSL